MELGLGIVRLSLEDENLDAVRLDVEALGNLTSLSSTGVGRSVGHLGNG